MTSPSAFRGRTLSANVPEPISPRPNRDRAPPHRPTVTVSFGLNSTILGTQTTILYRTLDVPAALADNWEVTGVTSEAFPWRLIVTNFSEAKQLYAHLDINIGAGFVSVSTYQDFTYDGRPNWWTGLQRWPGLETNAQNYVGVEITGPQNH